MDVPAPDLRDGSLRACGAERGVPILVYEAGEALRFHEVSIRAGLRGVLNIMRHLGMLPAAKTTKSIEPVIAASTSWVRAPDSGIVSRKVKLGARVVEGQRLASVGDPLNAGEESIVAPFDGIVVTAAATHVPAELLEQLRVGAVLVAPVETRGMQRLLAIRRTEDGYEEEDLGGVIFVPLLSGLS